MIAPDEKISSDCESWGQEFLSTWTDQNFCGDAEALVLIFSE
jgi:hypothetical protein